MERLTAKRQLKYDTANCLSTEYVSRPIFSNGDEIVFGEAIDRLAAYEDTGFTPEEIHQQRFLIAAQKDPEKLARLRDIVLADEAGRLVVLPCKVGDTVYRVFSAKDRDPVVVPCEIKTVGQAADLVGRIGKKGWMVSTYLSRQEAEEALREEADHA